MKILALDIGGTAVKYGVFHDGTEQLGQFSVKDENGNEAILQNVSAFCSETAADYVAVSTPGPFEYETGTSRMQHKLHSLYGISLKDTLKKILPALVLIKYLLTVKAKVLPRSEDGARLT